MQAGASLRYKKLSKGFVAEEVIMPCHCAEWYRSSAEKFKSLTDEAELAHSLGRLAAKLSFPRALLILEYPTPFNNHQCVIISHGIGRWSGAVQDPVIESIYTCIGKDDNHVAGRSWEVREVPDAFQVYTRHIATSGLSGIVHHSLSCSGVLYNLVFIREGSGSAPIYSDGLAMKVACLADWVKDAGGRIGLDCVNRLELTRREREILRWTADGKNTGEIASILFISENTVNYHIKKIINKTNSCSKFQAASRAAIYRNL